MNVNYNNLYCDYIGAIGGYSISDYIDITSNTLATNINELTSNTYHININNSNCLINTSNTMDVVNGSLINVSNTYIYNNYQYGEIRFKIKDDNKIYVKIGRDGKLYLWITYTILRPEILAGWYEVSDILADYFFNLAIINGVLTAYGADLVYLQEQVNVLDAGVGSIEGQVGGIIATLQIHTNQINELIALQPESLVSAYLDNQLLNPSDIVNNIINNGINSVSRLSTGVQSLLNLGGLGLIGWIGVGTYNYFARLREEQQEKNLRLNNIYGTLLLNSNTSNLDVPDINNPGKSLRESLYNNIFSNMEYTNNLEIIYTSNMIRTLGFVNSNITTQQLIPKLKSNEITLNNKAITKFSLDNLDDWIKTTHGIYYDITNGTIAINSTPTSTDFFRVGGQTTVQGELIAEGRIKENSLYLSNVYASSNYLLNVSNVIIRDSSNFTLGTSNILRGLINTNLSNSSNYASNISNVIIRDSSNFTLGTSNILRGLINTNLSNSSNYASNISNVIITNANNTYLKLSGGVMSGQITGVSTISATTGIFGQVATTNNTNTGAPTNGVYGGTGDKLILWAGAVGTTLPYSLGINASTLWYSVPTGATHKFYSGGGNPKMTILGNGNIGIGTDNPSQILQVGNAGRLRISNGTTDYSLLGTIDTDGATNTRIVVSGNTRGSGFAGNIDYVSTASGSHIFYNSTTERMRILNNGNVGININNPRCHLEVAGIGCINNGSPYAVVANFMQSGSLTIGGTNASYGGGVSQWTTNTAGLLLECSVNTEIAVHDANTRVASLMYYEGEGTNRITIGRNMGWSAISSVVINGALSLKNSDWHKSIDNANRFYFANNGFTQYGNGGGVVGHEFVNNTNSPILTLNNDNNVRCTNNLEVVNYLYSKSYICTAEDYSYVVNWNGTTNSGWFVGLNKYWYSGHTCLNVSITALNAGGTQQVCWFGRVYLSFAAGANTGTPPANNGGVIQIITDYRYPASWTPTNYYITVGERWDGSGNNTLYVYLSNPNYAGTLRVKIRG